MSSGVSVEGSDLCQVVSVKWCQFRRVCVKLIWRVVSSGVDVDGSVSSCGVEGSVSSCAGYIMWCC